MTDSTTHQRLRVSTDGTAGPYIVIPEGQLEEVKTLLGGRGIGYWVDENVISLNGEPYVAVVNLGRAADAAAVQEILDDVK